MAVLMRCVLILCLYIQSCRSDRVRRGYCSPKNLDIRNGNYRLRSGNSVADFTCNDGFQLYGVERAVCFGLKWSDDPPICIANTCKEILPTSTLRIEKEFDGAVLKFSCAALFKLKGEKTLVCDGTEWSAPTPSCLSWTPPISCDFEDPELCEWSHHDKDDQDWRWNTGETTTTRTGPSHDHTLGSGGEGHYMYFETSSPARTDHQAVLLSPLYPADYSSQKCFTFWYHILGSGDIGDLEVYFKPESVTDLKTLKPVFHVNEDGGDVWYSKNIRIPSQKEPFQVLLVGTRGTSFRSDFAVDDVALELCKDTISTTKLVTTSSTTRTTKQTTVPVTTTQPKATSQSRKMLEPKINPHLAAPKKERLNTGIETGCVPLDPSQVTNLDKKVVNGVLVKFSCLENYTLIGESMAYCNGKDWSFPLPRCAAGTSESKTSLSSSSSTSMTSTTKTPILSQTPQTVDTTSSKTSSSAPEFEQESDRQTFFLSS